MSQRIGYLLKKFPSFEWSGPAWYNIEKDDAGFPIKMTMEYFHPLHLGSASETDWDGKELLKIYKDLSSQFPEIGKTWIQGNIHSHHSMGAFFSGTDKTQLIDGANENFYGSLVVSTKPGKEYAFAISYPDQYGICHITQGDVIPEEIVNVDSEIVNQAEYIKKLKDKEPKLYTKNTKQTTMFKTTEDIFEAQAANVDPNLTSEEANDMQLYYSAMNELTNAEFEKFDKVWLQYETGIITRHTRDAALKQMGLDKNGNRLNSIAL